MKVTTAGESHGKALIAVVEGLPSGLKVDLDGINAELALRQKGYGRGKRQSIECDRCEILSGIRGGVTLGSPVTLVVWNRDYENWKAYMAPEDCDVSARTVTKVRPGHADLSGLLKYGGTDARNILERASARETAVRVAVGALFKQFLFSFGVKITGYVRSVGSVADGAEYTFDEIEKNRSEVLGMVNGEAEAQAVALIERKAKEGDTLGGVCEVRIRGLKSGFGSCMTYAEKLDARLAGAVMSVQAVKGVEIGLGFSAAERAGSAVHDEIFYGGKEGFYRKSNRAGGIEGGMSNGEEIVLSAAMKPIPTLMKGLDTVDYVTKEAVRAATERSDVCAIFAFERIIESVAATELAKVVAERLGGDRMDELTDRYGRLV